MDRLHCDFFSVGEALVDVVQKSCDGTVTVIEHVGGSLLNVAAGLAALNEPSYFATWFGNDDRGKRIYEHLQNCQVHLLTGSRAAKHTAVAYAKLDENACATYEFDLEWDLADLDFPAENALHLHTGSIAATIEPGGSKVLELVKRARKDRKATISYDPNIRPALMGEPSLVSSRVEELVSLAHVVKASEEDLCWLYPERDVIESARAWSLLGPSLMVVTRGSAGAAVFRTGGEKVLEMRPFDVPVVDTVGAGDSFMAGLLSGLAVAGLLGNPQALLRLQQANLEVLTAALQRANATSSLTVSKAGAYSPSLEEVNVILKENRLG